MATHQNTGGTVVSSYTYAVNPISQRTSVTTASIVFAGSNSIVECSLHPSSFNLHHSFSWGIDLSGTLRGAGGVGGLLAVNLLSSVSGSSVFYPTYDGNGNVSDSLATNGGVTVHYEYDPFGNLTRLTGNTSTRFSYRFSTKPRDPTTGLYDYGYRWFDPYTGRWVNRDPIEERGGIALYAFVSNRSANSVDFLGLAPRRPKPPRTFEEQWNIFEKAYPDRNRRGDTARRETMKKGCVGYTCLVLGHDASGPDAPWPDLSVCYFRKEDAIEAQARMEKAGTCCGEGQKDANGDDAKPRLFAVETPLTIKQLIDPLDSYDPSDPHALKGRKVYQKGFTEHIFSKQGEYNFAIVNRDGSMTQADNRHDPDGFYGPASFGTYDSIADWEARPKFWQRFWCVACNEDKISPRKIE